jgi:hypothetical protein
MTSHRYKRCAHCRSVYEWQSSGSGCQRQENDIKYCPECKKVIIDALSSVAVKYECVWVPTDEVDIEILSEQREKHYKKHLVERVVLPLWDMHDLENVHNGFYVKYNGKNYKVETWSKKPGRNSIEVEMQKEIKTGKLTFWKDC